VLLSDVLQHRVEETHRRPTVDEERPMKIWRRRDHAAPQRKISETFLDFASPIMDNLPDDASAAYVESVLKTPYVVWNAMVLYEVKGDRHFLDQIQAAMAQFPEGAALVNLLIERKRTMFGHDHRLIGIYAIIEKRGELVLRADVRAIPP